MLFIFFVLFRTENAVIATQLHLAKRLDVAKVKLGKLKLKKLVLCGTECKEIADIVSSIHQDLTELALCAVTQSQVDAVLKALKGCDMKALTSLIITPKRFNIVTVPCAACRQVCK